jgi:hypothetical protein
MMGVNMADASALAALAFRKGARFLIAGGDFIDGYSTSPEDLRTQFWAAKQALAGFWRERQVFPVIGNHDASIEAFAKPGPWPAALDRRPYATDSTEAVFSDVFPVADNGPVPSDPGRPAYRGTVYSTRQGAVRLIVFNDNYWISDEPKTLGGAPVGYMFPDQLSWIESELRAADADPRTKAVILAGHCPALPSAGHVKEAMFHDGDNNPRAYVWRDGTLRGERTGMLEARNRLLRAAASSPKVAAVLGSDEHAYHRVRLDGSVPVGDPARDDVNGDGRIDWKGREPASPLSELKNPVWYVTSGGGGAPYYSEQPSPWSNYWKARKNPAEGYRFSSQQNILVFNWDGAALAMTALNPQGEVIDEIPDLFAIKRAGR